MVSFPRQVGDQRGRIESPGRSPVRKITLSSCGQNGVPGHSNQMLTRLADEGSRKSSGMNISVLSTPTTANISDTRAIGSRQWLLTIRCVTEKSGADAAVVSRKA